MPPEEPVDPGWEYLVSHHLPSRFNRTLRVRLGGRTVHLCARCSGQGLGVLAWLVVLLACLAGHLPLFAVRVQCVVAFFPLLPAWDWVTQSAGRRESNNSLRLVSGTLLGFAFTDLVATLLLGRWTLFIGGVLILAAYLVALMAILRWSGAWRRVLQEHFPGVDLGPGS